MKKEQILYDLRKQIPSFTCIPGCHSCCGPVPLSKIELKAVRGIKKNPSIGLSCPYECEKGCAIYKDRPIICRLFGTVDDPLIKCPYGFMSENILNKIQANKIMEVYMRELIGNTLNRFTTGKGLGEGGEVDTSHLVKIFNLGNIGG
jgi:hypothetical protein